MICVLGMLVLCILVDGLKFSFTWHCIDHSDRCLRTGSTPPIEQCFINIVDIAELTDIESTLRVYRSSLCIVPPISRLHPRHRGGHCNIGPYQVLSCLHRSPYTLFTSSILSILHWLPKSIFTSYQHRLSNILSTLLTLSASQCWSTSGQHHVYIVPFFFLFTLSTSQCWST